MKIQFLATGCGACEEVYAHLLEAIAALGVEAQVDRVENLVEVLKFGVFQFPVIIIDGEVVSKGDHLSVGAIKQLLEHRI